MQSFNLLLATTFSTDKGTTRLSVWALMTMLQYGTRQYVVQQTAHHCKA